MDKEGKKIINFQENNLHVVGYSVPINQEMEFDELQEHLFSLPDMPDAIPYITSYFKPFWGFCITKRQREQFKKQRYQVNKFAILDGKCVQRNASLIVNILQQ